MERKGISRLDPEGQEKREERNSFLPYLGLCFAASKLKRGGYALGAKRAGETLF